MTLEAMVSLFICSKTKILKTAEAERTSEAEDSSDLNSLKQE